MYVASQANKPVRMSAVVSRVAAYTLTVEADDRGDMDCEKNIIPTR